MYAILAFHTTSFDRYEGSPFVRVPLSMVREVVFANSVVEASAGLVWIKMDLRLDYRNEYNIAGVTPAYAAGFIAFCEHGELKTIKKNRWDYVPHVPAEVHSLKSIKYLPQSGIVEVS